MTSMISHDQVGHWPDEAFEFFLRRQIDFKYVEDLASDIWVFTFAILSRRTVMRDRRTGLSYQVIHKQPSSTLILMFPVAKRGSSTNGETTWFQHSSHWFPASKEGLWEPRSWAWVADRLHKGDHHSDVADSSLPCVSSLKSTISVWFIDVSIMFPLIPNHIGRPRRFLPRGCISPSFGFISLPFSSWKHILRPMTASTSFISGLQINCQTIRVLDRYIDNCNLVGQKIFTNFSGQASPILSCWEKPWRLDRREYWGKVSASNQVWPEL